MTAEEEVGIAMFQNKNNNRTYKKSNKCPISTVEVTAFLQSIQFIINEVHSKNVILSDSLCKMNSIKNNTNDIFKINSTKLKLMKNLFHSYGSPITLVLKVMKSLTNKPK